MGNPPPAGRSTSAYASSLQWLPLGSLSTLILEQRVRSQLGEAEGKSFHISLADVAWSTCLATEMQWWTENTLSTQEVKLPPGQSVGTYRSDSRVRGLPM